MLLHVWLLLRFFSLFLHGCSSPLLSLLFIVLSLSIFCSSPLWSLFISFMIIVLLQHFIVIDLLFCVFLSLALFFFLLSLSSFVSFIVVVLHRRSFFLHHPPPFFFIVVLHQHCRRSSPASVSFFVAVYTGSHDHWNVSSSKILVSCTIQVISDIKWLTDWAVSNYYFRIFFSKRWETKAGGQGHW